MVELTGELAEEAQEVLNDLHVGIDVGKHIVTATHDFETKLLATDMLFMHIDFNYSHYEDLNGFFVEVSETIVELRDELEALGKGEIHILLEEEATEKKSTKWALKHRKKIEEEIKEEIEVDINIIKKIQVALVKIRRFFEEAEHLFSIHIKTATVEKMKIELEEGEEEVKHILRTLLQFILVYEKIFTQARNKLVSRK